MIGRPFALVLAFAAFLGGCENADRPHFQGWVEADLVFVGPDEPGRIEVLAVREGDTVEKGALLIEVDDDLQRADVAMAEAALANARQAFERAQSLLKTAAGTQKALDDAEAALRTAEARLAAAKTRLARRRIASPASGTVQQVYFRVGEQVPAGRPVLALLPPGNVKIRFFVPEATLPRIAVGDPVAVRCDGCPGETLARIAFIARSAEFTPPVIYSRDERSKLVFLVEARPQQPDRLRVGQPVDVSVVPAERRQ